MILKIVIGTWPLSGDYGHVDLTTIHNVLTYCYERGLREFDTAPNYGNGFSEFCLGKLFKDKSDVKINTKIGNLPFVGKSFLLENIQRSFKDSLKRLQKTEINTLFLHNPRNDVDDYKILLNFMNELKQTGLIKNIGLSKAKGFDYSQLVDLSNFDVIQDEINLIQVDSKSFQKPNGKILMARSPLANGILSGNLTSSTVFSKDDHRSEWLVGDRLKQTVELLEQIKQISSLPLAELAIRFILSITSIDKTIFGIKSKDHLDFLLSCLEKEPLSQDLIQKLISLHK